MGKEDQRALAKKIGLHIASQRKALGWTQDKLAEQMGVDAETISRFERGANLPSVPTLARLGEAMRFPVFAQLFDPATTKRGDTDLVETWLAGLGDADRQFALDHLRSLCEYLRGQT